MTQRATTMQINYICTIMLVIWSHFSVFFYCVKSLSVYMTRARLFHNLKMNMCFQPVMVCYASKLTSAEEKS